MDKTRFKWDAAKDLENQRKHQVAFGWAQFADVIRIIGAGYWRKGKMIYEEKNQIHR